MLSEPPATKPRRNWHLLRWAFFLIALSTGWGAWKAYDFQQAVKEAKELGWVLKYSDPIVTIREDWRNAFRKDTWFVTERELSIHKISQLEGHFDVMRRLDPNQLSIFTRFPLSDLSELKSLSNLNRLLLYDCTKLTNIDALKGMKGLSVLLLAGSPTLANLVALKDLKNLRSLVIFNCAALSSVDALRHLKALKILDLTDCHGLKNVDGVLELTGLKNINLSGCDKLTEKAVDAVKAAFPNIYIQTPDSKIFTLGGKTFTLGGESYNPDKK